MIHKTYTKIRFQIKEKKKRLDFLAVSKQSQHLFLLQKLF